MKLAHKSDVIACAPWLWS